MSRAWIFAVLVSVLSGCATGAAKTGSAASPATPKPKQVEIQFSGKTGDESETRYYSNSRTNKFSDGQLTNDRTEIVEFSTTTKIKSATPEAITSVVKTVKKDGTVNLHDLAFPELGETIDFVVKPNAQIIKAGNYSTRSIFYVPSLPTPGRPVEIGDTWPMEHTWLSGRENIPLKLSVVGILKDVVPCEGNYCADIEVSGNVSLVAMPNVPGSHFESRVWGRLLFSLKRGDVVWSEMRSREEMAVDNGRTVVESCMVSQMKLNEKMFKSKLECDPKTKAVETVPNL